MDRKIYFTATRAGIVRSERELSPTVVADRRETYLMDACAYLLETNSCKPTPIRVREDRIGNERFTVLETQFTSFEKYRDWGEDFYIDPETLVCKAVAFKSDTGRPYEFYVFDDYRSIDQISVPGRVSGFGSAEFAKIKDLRKIAYSPLTMLFNVPYDPQVFELPPSAAEGATAWKRK